METRTCYIAAPWQLRSKASILRAELAQYGIKSTARWISDHRDTTDPEGLHEQALHDLEDIRRADHFIALNPADWHKKGTGGRHVELGYALAMQKPITVIGGRSNVFHYLNSMYNVSSVEEFARIWGYEQRTGDETI